MIKYEALETFMNLGVVAAKTGDFALCKWMLTPSEDTTLKVKQYEHIWINCHTVHRVASGLSVVLRDSSFTEEHSLTESIATSAGNASSNNETMKKTLGIICVATNLLETPRPHTFVADFNECQQYYLGKMKLKIDDLPEYVKTLYKEAVVCVRKGSMQAEPAATPTKASGTDANGLTSTDADESSVTPSPPKKQKLMLTAPKLAKAMGGSDA